MANEVAVQTANPFGSKMPAAANNAVAHAESERAIQEVQAALVIAKKFPRNAIEAMDRILNACQRPTLAESALYTYARGGTEITGPSIRLAEAIAQNWGNMQTGIRELSAENGVSTVEAFAWDIETNTRDVKIFQVPHVRFAGGQLKRLTDPRDIYEMIANQGSRRKRACILAVIPGDVVEAARVQCEETQKTTIDVNSESIKKMVEAFETEYRITKELIEKRIQRRVESITAVQMLSLKRVFQSLRDGMGKPSDYFDVEDAASLVEPKVSDLNESLQKKRPAKDTENPQPKSQPHSAESPSMSDVQKRLESATTLDALNEAADLIRDVKNETHRTLLDEIYEHRSKQLN